jgi:hypothetical protein
MSVPSSSKNRMTTDWASPATSRMLMPPCERWARTSNRVVGTGATSRSSTLTPAALSPAMTARFSMRADRLASRDVVTVDPFFRVEA